jgi:hypothetical protein
MVYQIQVSDMDGESSDRAEGVKWMNYLLESQNPALVQGGIFLASVLNVDVEKKAEAILVMKSESLDPLQILEAQSLTELFEQHSNELLRELADWIPQWLEIES